MLYVLTVDKLAIKKTIVQIEHHATTAKKITKAITGIARNTSVRKQ
jgi:hypothetical protein